jgi:hypothetical protein
MSMPVPMIGKPYLLSMDHLDRPLIDEVPAFYRKYIELTPGGDLLQALELTRTRNAAMLERIPASMATHRYAPEKWTIAEVFQHIIDCERIFQYRALRFARNDATELPGFDEDRYALAAAEHPRSLQELAIELDIVRSSTIALFRSFTSTMLMRQGRANDRIISVRALGWTIAGHHLHHLQIIDQRYLDHGPTKHS